MSRSHFSRAPTVAGLAFVCVACLCGLLVRVTGAAGAAAERSAASAPELDLSVDGIYTLQVLSDLLRRRAYTDVTVAVPYRDRTLFISAGHYRVPDLLRAIQTATGLVVRDLGGLRFLTAPDARQTAHGGLPILPAPLLARLNKDLRPLGKNVDLEKEGVPFPTSLFLQGKVVPYKDLSAAQQQYIVKLAVLHDWGGEPGWLEGDPRLPRERKHKAESATIRFGACYIMGYGVYRQEPVGPTSHAHPAMNARSWWLLQVAYDYRQDMIDFYPRARRWRLERSKIVRSAVTSRNRARRAVCAGHRLRCAAGLAAALCLACVVPAGAATQRTLFLNKTPAQALSGATVHNALQQDIGRLVDPVFAGGRLAFQSHISPFSDEEAAVPEDALARCIRLAHGKGIKVYGYVDALGWGTVGPGGPDGILGRHPDLAARDLDGACGQVGSRAYASPFNPKVRAALVALVAEIGSRYPTLDGIVLRCAMPDDDLLAYSQAARAAYIRAAGMDPTEIQLGEDPDASPRARDWGYWRVTQVGALVRAMAAAFREACPHGHVAVVGDAMWYREPMAERCATLDDWMDWCLHCGVDEVLLTCAWDDLGARGVYMAVTAMARRHGVHSGLTMLLSLRSGGRPADPVEQLAAQQGACPTSMALDVTDVQDLSRAAVFLITMLPKIEEVLGHAQPAAEPAHLPAPGRPGGQIGQSSALDGPPAHSASAYRAGG